MKAPDQKYGSRKFIISIFILFITLVLGVFEVLSGTHVTIIVTAVGAGYGLTNVADKHITTRDIKK